MNIPISIIVVALAITAMAYLIYLILGHAGIKIPSMVQSCIEIAWRLFLAIYAFQSGTRIAKGNDLSTGRKIFGLIFLFLIIICCIVAIIMDIKKLYKEQKLSKKVFEESPNTGIMTVASPEDQADYDRAAKGEKK